MITEEELAAIAAALSALESEAIGALPADTHPVSRWKRAARSFDVEADDVPAVR